jgi:hypothetical protein
MEVPAMARNGRTLAVTTLTAAMALTLLGGPVAQAQDDKPFCAILTDAEVSAAVGADVAPTYGDDRSCDWASGAEDVYTSLSVTNGGTQLTDAKEFFPGGEDTTVAGRPTYLLVGDFNNVMYIDRGDGDTLSFQLLGEPDTVDAGAALRGLGELAFPRLATLDIPTPTPYVAVQEDTELAARFPTEIGGKPVQAQTQMATPSDDADEQAAVDAFLAAHGKSMADVSSGFAFGADPSYSIFAVRIKGADAAAMRDQFLGMSGIGDAPTPGQVAGKDVGVMGTGDQMQYVYTKDDVIWLVAAQEPILTEIFQKLP